jgi:hypothetical protein
MLIFEVPTEKVFFATGFASALIAEVIRNTSRIRGIRFCNFVLFIMGIIFMLNI